MRRVLKRALALSLSFALVATSAIPAWGVDENGLASISSGIAMVEVEEAEDVSREVPFDAEASPIEEAETALDVLAESREDPEGQVEQALSNENARTTPGWKKFGTCEWRIDDLGHLTIRPLDNASVGDLPEFTRPSDWTPSYNYHGTQQMPQWPWNSSDEEYLSVSFEGTVKAHGFIYGFLYLHSPESDKYVFDGLDTSDVTDMTAMFFLETNIESLDLSAFDTSRVTDFSLMFAGCKNLKSVNLSSFDTANAESFFMMFSRCASLEELDLGNFDTSNATDISGMFEGCTSLKSVNLSSFNTKSVERMNSLFNNCENIEEIDLSSFSTEKTVSMNNEAFVNPAWYGRLGMFAGCTSLKKLDISNFNTSNVELTGGYVEDVDDAGEWKGERIEDINSLMFGRPLFGFEFCPLESIALGCNFTFQKYLPDNTWYNTKGEEFTPATMPVGVADTYRTFKTTLSISLSETVKTVEASSGAFTLTATVTPADAFNGAVAWSSSNTSVATVDASGNVTPLKAGTTTISASAGGMSAQCLVTVTDPAAPVVPVESIVLSSSTLELKGQSLTYLNATVMPEDATYKSVVWTSSDEKVVRVSSSGEVRSVGRGTATVTATSQDGRASATCQVTVLNPLQAVDIVGLPSRFEVGSMYALSVAYRGVFPGEIDMDREPDITWELSNSDTATLQANGKSATLTCAAPGRNQLTASFGFDGFSQGGNTCAFDIVWPVPDSVSISEASKKVLVGADPFVLVATVVSPAAPNIPVSWTSSDASVATVDDTGRVTVLKRGAASITAQAGSKSASCALTVDGRSFPAADDSEFDGYVMANDSATAKKLEGMRLRINQSERTSADEIKYAAIASSGAEGSMYVDAFDIDLVDAAGVVHPWNEPDNSIVVYVALDDLKKRLFAEMVPGVHFIGDDASITEAKNTWVEGDNLAFETTHFSTYALTASPKPVEGGGTPGTPTPATPNNTSVGSLMPTGDSALALAALAVVGCAAGAVAFFAHRARRRDGE